MSTVRVTPLLRFALGIDAAISGITALLMAGAAPVLAAWTRLPEPLLFWLGLCFLPYVVVVAWMAARPTLRRVGVWAVIACNGIYAIDCIWLLASGYGAPNGLGQAFLIMQATAVGVFAGLQWLSLRRTGVDAPA